MEKHSNPQHILLKGAAYGGFLRDIFEDWVHHDVGKVFVQIFDVALEIFAGFPSSLCVFAETCGKALVLEHNGDLYSCDHFVDMNNWSYVLEVSS